MTYLFIKLDKNWFKEFINILALMVWVLSVTETLAHFCFLREIVGVQFVGQGVKGYDHVPGVSYLLKFNMGYFFVVHDSGVVGGHIAWEFGEISCHFII